MRRLQLHQFFADHLLSLVFVVVLFVVGIGLGAAANNSLSFDQKQELLAFLQSFFNPSAITSGNVLLAETLKSNCQTAGLVALSGALVFGLPLAVVIIFFQGFVLGFSVGFVIRQLGLKGLLLAGCSILPHNLLLMPAILLIGAQAVRFAVLTVASMQRHRQNYGRRLLALGKGFLPALAVIFLGSLVEAWFSPFLVRLAAGLLASP